MASRSNVLRVVRATANEDDMTEPERPYCAKTAAEVARMNAAELFAWWHENAMRPSDSELAEAFKAAEQPPALPPDEPKKIKWREFL
jgi:hypothetical protein